MIKIILIISFVLISPLKTSIDSSQIEGCQSSCEMGGVPDKCCSYWTNSYEENPLLLGGYFPYPSATFSCTTGGISQCVLGECGETSEPVENEANSN